MGMHNTLTARPRRESDRGLDPDQVVIITWEDDRPMRLRA